MDDKFYTEDVTLEKLVYRRFIIPSYQRPYVWGDEQINKLLSDFYDAFKEFEEGGDAYYYVGTVLLNKQNKGNKTIEQIIDGQQRFTTLWLIASVFKVIGSNSKIIEFLRVEEELRIDFAIRKQIKNYMLSLYDRRIENRSQVYDIEIEEDEYLSHIAKAVATISGRLLQIDKDKLDNFGDYIYEKVHFVVNAVPENTDLKKLFATINNSGIQLEQSDILKSLLINKIEKNKDFYSSIWEACENMNDYFERNVKQLFPHNFDWDKIKDYDDLSKIELPSRDRASKDNQQDNAFTIAEILKNDSINNRTIDLRDIENNPVTIIENASITDITNISGKLFGEWISIEDVKVEYCSFENISDSTKRAQFKIFDDRFAKGIELELIQNNKDIDARIVWAKASHRRSENNKQLLELDWNDMSLANVQSLDNNIPLGRKGYGIAEITVNPIDFQHNRPMMIDDDSVGYCRSIITFPQFLLHTYRIFLFYQQAQDFELPFHTDRLIQIFKSQIKKKDNEEVGFKSLVDADEEIIKKFFEYLWKVRCVFDKYVVKWVQKEKDTEEVLSLTNIPKQDNFFSRVNKEKDAMSTLQSMLYFTGNYNTQIWLTPFLCRLISDNPICENEILFYLERIDNDMSLSKLTDKQVSFELMQKGYKSFDKFDFESYLRKSRGTSFKHYWFQKLEYILWKEFNKDKEKKSDDKFKNKFKNYRITSKNSVEHVYPQNPESEYGDPLETEILDSFGNLVLLSVSQNSSYSNQDVEKKKHDFNKKETYDSLKLKLIYDNPQWSRDAIKKHSEEMIKKIKDYYNESN